MPEYRAYLIGSDGHFKNSIPLVCDSDDAAQEEAKKLVDGHDVELWQRGRMIATLKRKTDAQ